MSTTVHYFGKIKSPELLNELQEEFREIAQVSGWSHEMVDHVFAPEGEVPAGRLTLRGVRLTLSKSTSPVQFTFDKDGYLSHIFYEKAPAEMPGQRPTGALRQVLHQVHTSTTLRGGDSTTHVSVVRLLDYLKKRYVPNLEVIDNTGYWSSRDEAVLVAKPLELAKK